MRVRTLNNLHDWQFGKGQNDYARDQRALMQNINTRLNSFLGDCFFNEGAGIDWFNILGAKDEVQVDLIVASTILNTEGVVALRRLVLELDVQRNLNIRYQVHTIYSVMTSIAVVNLNQIG